MITVNDILTQFQSLKSKINEYYTLIYNEVEADANLEGLTSTSKTAEFNLWMWMYAAMSAIMDSVWQDRQSQIAENVARGIPGTDRWYQLELMKFQYGDSLSWDATNGKYYYAVIDPDKQIIARCAVRTDSGPTTIKVAKLSGGIPVALSTEELTAFRAYARQTQWAGAQILDAATAASDKLKAPMTVYYDGTKKLDDVKAIVEAAWDAYLAQLPYNGEYSVNKHGDFVETAGGAIIQEVTMGVVEARSDAGAFTTVARIYNPISGYLERDPDFEFDDLITYTPV